MGKVTYGFSRENDRLLKEAEDISKNLSIDLRSFYEEKVEISEQYGSLNNTKKVTFDELSQADSSAANNGFKGLVKELENILEHTNEFFDGDIDSLESSQRSLSRVVVLRLFDWA